jgi:selenocysteine lyase/cysteine desulfurase
VNQAWIRSPAADAFIHLNHASTSLPDRTVFDAQREFLGLEASLGMHRAIDRVGDALADVPVRIARLIGTRPEHIAFVDSAARGWAHALSAVAPGRRLEVFVSRQEWAANLMTLAHHERACVRVMPEPIDGNWARVVATALDGHDVTRVPVVSLPLQSSFRGVPNDLAGVAAIVQHAGGWLFVDASQAVGQTVVDMDALGADVLVFPARKWLRGPRGIGVLALSARALANVRDGGFGLPAMLDVHGTRIEHVDAFSLAPKPGASRFQAYDYSPALRLGLSAAVKVLLDVGADAVRAQVLALATELRRRLSEIDGVRLADAGGSGLVCLRVDGVDHSHLVNRLWQQGINVAAVGAVYAPLAIAEDNSVLRLSPHVTTEAWELKRVQEVMSQEIDVD